MNEIEKRISDFDENHSEVKIIKVVEMDEANLYVFDFIDDDYSFEQDDNGINVIQK